MTEKPKPLIIFGVNAVVEKLKSAPGEVFELMIVRGRESIRLNAVIEEARRHRVRVEYVDARRLDLLTEGGSHQGIAARTTPYGYSSLTDFLQFFANAAEGRVLVLDGLTDPRNFGALLRSAEGAGVAHVVICKDRAVGVTPVVVKTSAGAANYLKIYRVPNLCRALQGLKKAGCWIIGLDASAPESIYDRRYPEKLAVVLGSEDAGLRPVIRRECDFLASIPMLGNVSSLNVGVAGAVCLYELARQGGFSRAASNNENRPR